MSSTWLTRLTGPTSLPENPWPTCRDPLSDCSLTSCERTVGTECRFWNTQPCWDILLQFCDSMSVVPGERVKYGIHFTVRDICRLDGFMSWELRVTEVRPMKAFAVGCRSRGLCFKVVGHWGWRQGHPSSIHLPDVSGTSPIDRSIAYLTNRMEREKCNSISCWDIFGEWSGWCINPKILQRLKNHCRISLCLEVLVLHHENLITDETVESNPHYLFKRILVKCNVSRGVLLECDRKWFWHASFFWMWSKVYYLSPLTIDTVTYLSRLLHFMGWIKKE